MQTAQNPLQIFFITSITLSDGSAHLMNRCSGASTPKCERSKQKMQNFGPGPEGVPIEASLDLVHTLDR